MEGREPAQGLWSQFYFRSGIISTPTTGVSCPFRNLGRGGVSMHDLHLGGQPTLRSTRSFCSPSTVITEAQSCVYMFQCLCLCFSASYSLCLRSRSFLLLYSALSMSVSLNHSLIHNLQLSFPLSCYSLSI